MTEEERNKMMRSNWEMQMNALGYDASGNWLPRYAPMTGEEPTEFSIQSHYPLTEKERDALLDSDLDYTKEITFNTKHGKEVTFIKPIRCKDCRYYAVKDYWGNFHGLPVLGASDQPTCTKWGGGDCLTKPDGYCYLAEKKEAEHGDS